MFGADRPYSPAVFPRAGSDNEDIRKQYLRIIGYPLRGERQNGQPSHGVRSDEYPLSGERKACVYCAVWMDGDLSPTWGAKSAAS